MIRKIDVALAVFLRAIIALYLVSCVGCIDAVLSITDSMLEAQRQRKGYSQYGNEPVHRLSRLCKVSYKTMHGWSDEVLVEVEFLTGGQLNQATRSYKFEAYSNYALIWFSQEEVAILKCKEYLVGVGDVFDNDAFCLLYYLSDTAEFEQVNSEYPRQWRIRGKDYSGFIDPRADQ